MQKMDNLILVQNDGSITLNKDESGLFTCMGLSLFMPVDLKPIKYRILHFLLHALL